MTATAHRPVELAGILADPDEQFTKDKRLLTDALDRLPDTSSGIAAYFVERGIKGVPHGPSFCPVANYVRQEIDDMEFVSVSQNGIAARRADHPNIGVNVEPHVAQFITHFDSGLYPILSRERQA